MTLNDLKNDVIALAQKTPGRLLLGIAGPPAGGKSTLAEALVEALPNAQLLPMDGFHLDDGILVPRGDRPRKGAPHTFDVAGFCAFLKRARTEPQLYAPKFDRAIETSRGGAIEITADTEILIVEGNWLLHDTGGWECVRPLLDACWYVDTPEEELASRLMTRWSEFPEAEARRKIEANDLPNARTVAQGKDRADRILTNVTL